MIVMPPAPVIGAAALIGVSRPSSSPITDIRLRDQTMFAASCGMSVFFCASSGVRSAKRAMRDSMSSAVTEIVFIRGLGFSIALHSGESRNLCGERYRLSPV